jgi:glycerophosphoryl diester phosphodiesterase
VAIVFHDCELDRLTGEQGPLAARSAQELARCELAAGGAIPMLQTVLDLTDSQVPLLIELKSRRAMPVAPLCESVARALENHRGLHAVMSFEPRVGRCARAGDKRVRQETACRGDRPAPGAMSREGGVPGLRRAGPSQPVR